MIRHSLTRRALGALGLTAVLVALTAIAAPAEAKIFRTSLRADPAMMDPITYSEIVAGDVLTNIYEGFSQVEDDGRVTPALATRWEMFDDAKGWRFHLRRGVKFHSGREFTANDVKFTMETLMTPGMKGGLTTTYLKSIVGAKAMSDGAAREIAGIKIVDDYTVEIRLTEADVLFPIYPFYFMDRRVPAEHGPDWMTKVSAGTGPFKFVHWKRGVEIKLDAHKDYWGGAPTIEGVQFLIVPSGDTTVTMFDAGEIDFAYIPESAVRRVMTDPRYKDVLIQAPRAQARYLGMNQNLYAPFKDRRVREAVSIAIDRDAMIKGLYNGAAFPLAGQVMPGVGGFDPARKPVPFDAERARRLLAEAGFAGGQGLPPVDISSTDVFKDEITYYANQLKRVLNMTVNVKIVERGTFIRAMNAGEVAFFPWGWTAGYPDGMYFLSQMWHSASPFNRPRWKNEAYDRVIDQAKTVANDEERYKLYHQAEGILLDDWGTAPLPIPVHVALRKPNVTNVTMTPFGYSSFARIEIK